LRGLNEDDFAVQPLEIGRVGGVLRGGEWLHD
jgi:hypothetical protein